MNSNLFLFALLAALGGVLGNSLISRRSYPMLGSNHCTWGPSYWCSHVSNAKECGTLKHCAAVWGKQLLNNPAELCETCEYFVIGAQKLHAHKIAQEKIGLYMNTLCYQMTGKEKEKCLSDISLYLTEVLELLDLGLTPRAVCYSINLCPQSKTAKLTTHSNAAVTSTTIAPNTTATTTTATTTTATTTTMDPRNKDCNDCKVFFNDVRKRLRSNETVKNVENLFDSTVCVNLGPFRDMCHQLIDAFVPVYLEDVSELVDPGFLCSILNFCPATQKTALFEALSQNSLPSALMISDVKECVNCKIFVKNIKKEVDSQTTVDEVKHILEEKVCSHLGSYESVCKMAVETYAQEILEAILKNVDASIVCKKLGLCDGYLVMNSLVAHLKAVKFSKPHPFEESTECELCKVLMSELHSLVEDKKIQNAVRDFINNEVCSRLESMKEACLTLVKEYEPLIMKAIQGLLDPSRSCAMLGMCSNSSDSKIVDTASKPSLAANSVPLSLLSPAIASSFIPYQRVGLVLPPKTEIKSSQSEECQICLMVMGELEKILKDNIVQVTIEKALDDVCSLLPRSMSKKCTDFVNEYTPGIIDLLLSQIQPKLVCSALSLCTSSVSLPSASDSTGCSYCSEILGIASGHLSNDPNMSQEEFEKMLLKLCTKYGEQYKEMCGPSIKQFGGTVYKALKSDMSPREVCGMIGFCAASAIKPETKHYLDVMCELLKSAGVTTECKKFNQISKEVNNHFFGTILKRTGTKETNAIKSQDDCGMCTEVVHYLESFVTSEMSEEELKHLLHEVCGYFLSKSMAKTCDNIVDKYEDMLVHLLIQKLPAKVVCEKIGFCSKVWQKN